MSLKMLSDQLKKNHGGKNKRESKEATGADIQYCSIWQIVYRTVGMYLHIKMYYAKHTYSLVARIKLCLPGNIEMLQNLEM
jgi:hypothetical protein